MHALFVLLNILFFLMIASLRMIKLLVLGLRSLKIYLILHPFLFRAKQCSRGASEQTGLQGGFSKISFFLTLPEIQGFKRVRIVVMLASLQLLSLLQPELEAGLLQIWVVEDLQLLLLLKILQCHVLSLLFCRTLLILVGALHKGFIRAIQILFCQNPMIILNQT